MQSSALVEARRSTIHGTGVYALAPVRKGERIIEVVGERISNEEADRRYHEKEDDDGHTFFFYVDEHTVIDSGRAGNIARFINHSCEPNCETVQEEDGRVFVEALRAIQPGEELFYDYLLTWEPSDDPAALEVYACRCGARACRGTMLDMEPLTC